MGIISLTLWRPVLFEDFAPKQPEHMWLCVSGTLALKIIENCSKAQKTQQVFYSAL